MPHARVLLNQGNALAQLGIFQPAIEKLATALKRLTWLEAFPLRVVGGAVEVKV